MRAFLLLLFTLVIGIGFGWMLPRKDSTPQVSQSGNRIGKGAYRCSMHPWIQADRVGSCTICGMGMTLAKSTSKEADSFLRLGTGQIETMGVAVARVIRTNLIRTLSVAGRIVEADTRRKRLAAYVPGRIEKLHVNFEGAEVGRGEPLITIYSPLLLEAEREYRLLYRQSQMNHSTKITAEHGRLLAAMKQRLIQYGLTAEQIKRLPGKSDSISTSEILSPMDGMVTRQITVEGQYVEEGELMLEMADLYTMWFEFDVYENDLPLVQTGQRIQIDVPGSGKPPIDSVISFINPNLNLTKRTAEVRAELRNPVIRIQGRKTRGYQRQMYAEGEIQLKSPAVLTIPRSAVLDDGNRIHVFVEREPGIYDLRPVQIGFRGKDHWEVTKGLSAGEAVVITGLALLDSQMKL